MNDDLVKRLDGLAETVGKLSADRARARDEVSLLRVVIERLTAERDALRKRIEDEAAKAQPEQSDIKP